MNLEQQYAEAGSVAELARRLGVPKSTLYHRLKASGIQTKRSGYRSPRTVPVARGAEHHNWRGGSYVNGYRFVMAQGHHRADKDGYVLEHIIVAEQMLGREITTDEVVHHINGDKTDNRPENLDVLPSISEHMRLHKATAERDERGRFVA